VGRNHHSCLVIVLGRVVVVVVVVVVVIVESSGILSVQCCGGVDCSVGRDSVQKECFLWIPAWWPRQIASRRRKCGITVEVDWKRVNTAISGTKKDR
jgi:hypothetical protein